MRNSKKDLNQEYPTSGGGFDVGAWAIPSSFSSMWVNDCQGLCSYGYSNYDNSKSNLNTNIGSTNRGGGGNWGIVSEPTAQSTHIQPIANYYNTTNKYFLKTNEVNCVINSGNTIIGKGAEWANSISSCSKGTESMALLGKISKGSKILGATGLLINIGCTYYQIDNQNISWKEGTVRLGMTVAEFGLAFVPVIGPILSIGLTVYDIGGGFDNNLYNTENWWKEKQP